MSVNLVLVDEFLNLAIERLEEIGIAPTPERHHQIIKTWCDAYDDVPPRNRPDRVVRDALEEARERLHRSIHNPQPLPA